MAEHGRGSGVQNYFEVFYKAAAVGMASDLLRRATDDFLAFFPDAERRGAAIRTAAMRPAAKAPASSHQKHRGGAKQR